MSPPEINALLAASEGRWRIIILAAVLTGLREGELLGLSWGDIDWNTRQIYVRRTYSAGRFNTPKTASSRRKVDMPSQLVTELKRWKLECPPGERDLVFPSGAGNPENHSNLLRRGFYPALRRAGLRKIRFHDLRHTYASLLIANGENIKRIQESLGHSSCQITLDTYSHLLPGGGGGVAERLGALVFGSKTGAIDEVVLNENTQPIDLPVVRWGGDTHDQGYHHTKLFSATDPSL
ncbi:MAG: site-specific integrase [Gammaproteobacteria bacterium]